MHNVIVLEFLEDQGHKQTFAALKSSEGHVYPPSLTLDFNPFRDVWHRPGHMCPFLKSREGHVSLPILTFIWHRPVHLCPFSKVERDTCPILPPILAGMQAIQICLIQTGSPVPPPPLKLWEGHVPPLLAFNPCRDVWHRPDHLCPVLKLWEGHVPLPHSRSNPSRDVS